MDTIDLELVKSLASGYTSERPEESLSVQRARSMIAHALQGFESPSEICRFAEFIRTGRGDLKALIARIQEFVLGKGSEKSGNQS